MPSIFYFCLILFLNISEKIIILYVCHRNDFDYESAVQEYFRREGHMPQQEDIYDKEKHWPPKFKTQIIDLLNLKDNDAVHFECQLLPFGDPTMKIEWFKDGQPLLHGKL